MFLFLETLTSIIRTALTILVELINLVNSVISNDLTQMINFPTRIPDSDSYSPALLDLFTSSDASICSAMALSQFPLTFQLIHNGMSHFTT